MKTALPWICVVALLAGAGLLYSAGRSKDAALEQLRQDNAELPGLRAENERLKQATTPADELARLRKDNEDLLRLRNEVRQLREQGAVLTNELQRAQSATTQAQEQQQQEASRLAAQNRALLNQTLQMQQQATAQSQAAACINNLRQLEAAKQQWALEGQKPAGSVPTMADLTPYLPPNAQLVCPAGGVYTLNAIGQPATCSIPGHALQ